MGIERTNRGRVGVGEIAEYIRAKILGGEYGPEGRLVEEQIANEMGVSRTPVRRALTTLEGEGLVEIFPNRGAIVASFSFDEVWNVYDLRAVLEGLAARRAAQNITADELDELERIASEMEEIDRDLRGRDFPPGPLGDGEHKEIVRRLVNLNQDFHRTVVEASRNWRLIKQMRAIVQIPMVLKAYSWHLPDERSTTNHQHRMVLRSLRGGDSQRAELVMTEHIYEGRDVVLRALKEKRYERSSGREDQR